MSKYSKMLRGEIEAIESASDNSAQSESSMDNPHPIAGHLQHLNDAGGYVFSATDEAFIERFLILGTGGTYYVDAKSHTQASIDKILEIASTDEGFLMIVNTMKRVNGLLEGTRSLVLKPATSIFMLALLWKHFVEKRHLLEAFIGERSIVANMSLMMSFLADLKAVSHTTSVTASSRLKKVASQWFEGTSNWVYGNASPESGRWLAMQSLKYRNREGFSVKDVLRILHHKPESQGIEDVMAYLVRGNFVDNGEEYSDLILAYEAAKISDEPQLVQLIKDYGLTREMIPNKMLTNKVWRALLGLDGAKFRMPLMALVRNLKNMLVSGVFGFDSSMKAEHEEALKFVREILTGQGAIKTITRSRIHPMQFYLALKKLQRRPSAYSDGKKYDGEYDAVFYDTRYAANFLCEALMEAVMISFDALPKSDRKISIAMDVSGSMKSEVGTLGISSIEASAVMALVLIRSFPNSDVFAFTSQGNKWYGATEYRKIHVTPKTTIEGLMEIVNGLGFGNTDCSLPFSNARQNNVFYDGFIIMTDNEDWGGHEQPADALAKYRNQVNPNAKVIFAAFEAMDGSLNMPDDMNSIDIVGLDASITQVASTFFNGGEIDLEQPLYHTSEDWDEE